MNSPLTPELNSEGTPATVLLESWKELRDALERAEEKVKAVPFTPADYRNNKVTDYDGAHRAFLRRSDALKAFRDDAQEVVDDLEREIRRIVPRGRRSSSVTTATESAARHIDGALELLGKLGHGNQNLRDAIVLLASAVGELNAELARSNNANG